MRHSFKKLSSFQLQVFTKIIFFLFFLFSWIEVYTWAPENRSSLEVYWDQLSKGIDSWLAKTISLIYCKKVMKENIKELRKKITLRQDVVGDVDVKQGEVGQLLLHHLLCLHLHHLSGWRKKHLESTWWWMMMFLKKPDVVLDKVENGLFSHPVERTKTVKANLR